MYEKDLWAWVESGTSENLPVLRANSRISHMENTCSATGLWPVPLVRGIFVPFSCKPCFDFQAVLLSESWP
jgi:hypothetical protein